MTFIPSRYALDDSGPVNPRAHRTQEPFTCSICQREVTSYSSAAWNSETCDRCLPPNDNPELARIERMNANDRHREELAREKGISA